MVLLTIHRPPYVFLKYIYLFLSLSIFHFRLLAYITQQGLSMPYAARAGGMVLLCRGQKFERAKSTTVGTRLIASYAVGRGSNWRGKPCPPFGRDDGFSQNNPDTGTASQPITT